MVYRIFVEKKPGLAGEASSLCSDLRTLLGMTALENVRLFNRYDVENMDEALFRQCCSTIFSEPQLDNTYDELPITEGAVFAVEFLPGQYDQRADSAAQCVQLVSQGERPLVRSAKVYVLEGKLSDADIAAAQKYVINPVEARLASLDKPETLKTVYDIPTTVDTLEGFCALEEDGLREFLRKYSLAMDLDDVRFCRDYFRTEGREPTITEIRMLDTYWSDHCRHTTFNTTIEAADLADPRVAAAYDRYIAIRDELGRTKPINLMDIATIGAKYLRAKGMLDGMDVSEEINACTVRIKVDVNGEDEDWLLLFKNETHNHPTEIEPFGGAATCIGGAIRDPLSGRSYVYQAMRVTGAADPTKPIAETLPGKLPQRKLVTTAAAGYSSYGNQIGLATGLVDEIYHDGYVAKRMEIGAVVGAAPAKNVRREVPAPGDIVILLGARTGRDGCGGATGSSKSHTAESLSVCGAEVQKGNAPEERKLQRLFRNPEATRLIKRCNDFGAGGVSVAVGELADGLEIDLNAVPKKYEGLDGTELAISESQERMAVVLAPEDVETFRALASGENLESAIVATVTDTNRLRMHWNGVTICDISRDFLNSNGAPKATKVAVPVGSRVAAKKPASFAEAMKALCADLNVCSKKGLSERFDSTIGAGSVLMPFGGKHQLTPTQVMAAKLPVLGGETKTCSVMSWGYDPFVTEADPFTGSYLAVVESVSKLVASGAPLDDCYLTFQEYFEKPGTNPTRWGKPFAALLGAMSAQLDLGFAAIGGKDSMSGSFDDLDVPPTLVSFAITTAKTDEIRSPEFKLPISRVVLLLPEYDEQGIPVTASLKANYDLVHKLLSTGAAISAWTPTGGGVAEGILKMCLGNRLGFRFAQGLDDALLYDRHAGAFILELAGKEDVGILLGETTLAYNLTRDGETLDMAELQAIYENRLEDIFACNIKMPEQKIEAYSFTAETRPAPKVGVAKPRVLIPVFPGTNCEFDSARAVERAGGVAEIMVLNNLTPAGVAASVERFAKLIEESQIIFVPGGFSGGDEPDGSGKFITAFFRNPQIKEGVSRLLGQRDGLMAGICNGFQALIKLGLVPFGEIIDTDAACPTLTYNTIGRHQSCMVRTRIASNKSPWLARTKVGEIYTVPISHGEGRFLASDEVVAQLAANGQIATQYVDLAGNPTMDIRSNPNGSIAAIEGITSPDGRVFGKMGHSERIGEGLYRNVDGLYDIGMFASAVEYYKI